MAINMALFCPQIQNNNPDLLAKIEVHAQTETLDKLLLSVLQREEQNYEHKYVVPTQIS